MEEDQEEGVVEAPHLDIPAAIEKFLLETRGGWAKNGRIYASDLGLALGPEHAGCQLCFYLKCRNEPTKEETPGRLLMMQMGDLVHDYIGDALKMAIPIQGWRVVSIEERVYLDHDSESIGSRLDVLIEHIATGWRTVVDIKTKRGAAFGFLNEAKPGDVLQVQGYIKAKDADDGRVLYVDREGQNFMRSFPVERDDSRPEKAIEILKAIRDSDELPAPLGLRIKVVENKGPDSVYLNIPWQIEWCDLKACGCKAALPKGKVPDKIVAKLHPEKEPSSLIEVKFTDAAKGWEEVIVDLLNIEADNMIYWGTTHDDQHVGVL